MKTVTFSESDCCPQQIVTKNRFILPRAVDDPYFIYEVPLSGFSAKQKAIEFKSLLARRILSNPEQFEMKTGIVNSPAPGLQYAQGLGSTFVPGNITRYRRPVRSATWSALTPGGSNRGVLGRLGATAYGALKPERGYRCPEGYQFGGQFTNEQYTTCGRQLFALAAMLIRRGIGKTPNRRTGVIPYQELTSGNYRQQMYPSGTALSSRSADIPKVGKLSAETRNDAENAIYGSMAESSEPAVRLIRQDGFVIEPVVSAAVLRTVPDNRNMENSVYAMRINSPSELGNDELGLLSNSGVEKVSYVLPNGGLLQLRKARPLTVGERRKLGKTVSASSKIDISQDPSARLKFISSEMGDGIQYSERLGIKNPNDLIRVRGEGGRKKTVRRWHYEAFLKQKKESPKAEVEVNLGEKEELINDLRAAVRHLNSGGDVGRVASSIRITAMKRSSLYKSKKFKDGVVVFEKGDGLSLYEIQAQNDFENLGAAVSAQIQQGLGIAAPQVYLLQPGKRSSYLLTQAQDAYGRGSIDRNKFNSVPVEDMLAIAVSDWLTDTSSRNPSNIQPVVIGGRLRAVPGINPGALIGKMNTRYDIDFNKLYAENLSDQWRNYFDTISREQKQRVVKLLEQLIERAKSISVAEISRRLSVDGNLIPAEKIHLKLIEKLYDSRLKRLSASKKQFLQTIGATK